MPDLRIPGAMIDRELIGKRTAANREVRQYVGGPSARNSAGA
jgi:hypothetical protein